MNTINMWSRPVTILPLSHRLRKFLLANKTPLAEIATIGQFYRLEEDGLRARAIACGLWKWNRNRLWIEVREWQDFLRRLLFSVPLENINKLRERFANVVAQASDPALTKMN
jgi:hypothetical protein